MKTPIIKLLLIVIIAINLQSCVSVPTLNTYKSVSPEITEKYSRKDFDTLIAVQDSKNMIFLNKEGKLDKGISLADYDVTLWIIFGIVIGLFITMILVKVIFD